MLYVCLFGCSGCSFLRLVVGIFIMISFLLLSVCVILCMWCLFRFVSGRMFVLLLLNFVKNFISDLVV